jgi:DNA repair exonuclease SbcCD ATPase subunit
MFATIFLTGFISLIGYGMYSFYSTFKQNAAILGKKDAFLSLFTDDPNRDLHRSKDIQLGNDLLTENAMLKKNNEDQQEIIVIQKTEIEKLATEVAILDERLAAIIVYLKDHNWLTEELKTQLKTIEKDVTLAIDSQHAVRHELEVKNKTLQSSNNQLTYDNEILLKLKDKKTREIIEENLELQRELKNANNFIDQQATTAVAKIDYDKLKYEKDAKVIALTQANKILKDLTEKSEFTDKVNIIQGTLEEKEHLLQEFRTLTQKDQQLEVINTNIIAGLNAEITTLNQKITRLSLQLPKHTDQLIRNNDILALELDDIKKFIATNPIYGLPIVQELYKLDPITQHLDNRERPMNVDRFIKMLEHVATVYKRLVEHYVNYKAEYDSLTKELETAHKVAEALQEDLTKTNQHITELNQLVDTSNAISEENKSLKAQVTQLEANTNNSHTVSKNIQNAVYGLWKENKLNSEAFVTTKTLSELQKESPMLHEILKAKTEAVETSGMQLNKVREKLATVTGQLETLQKNTDNSLVSPELPTKLIISRLHQAEKTVLSQNKVIIQSTDRIDELTAALTKSHADKVDIENALTLSKKSNNQLEHEIATLKTTMKSNETQMIKDTAKVSKKYQQEAQKAIEDLAKLKVNKKDRESYETQNKLLSDELVVTKQQLHQMEEKLMSANNVISGEQGYKTEITLLNAKIKEL